MALTSQALFLNEIHFYTTATDSELAGKDFISVLTSQRYHSINDPKTLLVIFNKLINSDKFAMALALLNNLHINIPNYKSDEWLELKARVEMSSQTPYTKNLLDALHNIEFKQKLMSTYGSEELSKKTHTL